MSIGTQRRAAEPGHSTLAPYSGGWGVTLKSIELGEIPEHHPTRRAVDIYRGLRVQAKPHHMPRLEDVLSLMGNDLVQFALALLPVDAESGIDFLIIHHGHKMPGISLPQRDSKYYSENIIPGLFLERALEILSCLALRLESITLGSAPRPSALGMKVYRTILPVWKSSTNQHAIVLVSAPVFAALPETKPRFL